MRLSAWFLAVLLLAPGEQRAAEATPFATREVEGRVFLTHAGRVEVAVAPADGGELAGLALHHDGAWRQLLYRGLDESNAPGWRGKAPFLWPATGISRPAEGDPHHYVLDGETLPMPFHGFARDRSWRVVGRRAGADFAEVRLQLRDDAASREHYPFGFELQAHYRLHAGGLTIGYVVAAAPANERPMPFSIGNHVTFRAPLVGTGDPAGLRFETRLPTELLILPDKRFSGETRPSPWRGRHSIGELPHRSAISLGGAADTPALTLFDPAGLELVVRHQASSPPAEPSAQFTLWADAEDGFFSPEPWVGTQNSLNSGWGRIELEPGDTWRWTIDFAWSWHPRAPNDTQDRET